MGHGKAEPKKHVNILEPGDGKPAWEGLWGREVACPQQKHPGQLRIVTPDPSTQQRAGAAASCRMNQAMQLQETGRGCPRAPLQQLLVWLPGMQRCTIEVFRVGDSQLAPVSMHSLERQGHMGSSDPFLARTQGLTATFPVPLAPDPFPLRS